MKNIKFFEDKVNGKSKGYALVEYFNPEAAFQAKEKLQGKYVQIITIIKCRTETKLYFDVITFLYLYMYLFYSNRVNISFPLQFDLLIIQFDLADKVRNIYPFNFCMFLHKWNL